jgi:cytoskeletal protein CcmA (bactofilin family)
MRLCTARSIMAKSRKANVVDGYSAMKAAQHAAGVTPADVPDVRKPLEHAGKTTLPTRRPIICYECGYTYQLHGRVTFTVCSKCRAKLDCTDHVIESVHRATLKTVGVVHVTTTGRVENCEVVGHDVIVAGNVAEARVTALRQLEIAVGAVFSEGKIYAPNLRVGAGAEVQFERRAEYRDVTIAGALEATLNATGTVRVVAGGLFRGELRTAHWIVEEGGGLCAEVDTRPLAETDRPKRLAVV